MKGGKRCGRRGGGGESDVESGMVICGGVLLRMRVRDCRDVGAQVLAGLEELGAND